MRAVKGIYEDGVVALLEQVDVKDKQEVTVFIPEQGESDAPEALRFAGILRSLSAQETAAFDEALRRGVAFARRVHP